MEVTYLLLMEEGKASVVAEEEEEEEEVEEERTGREDRTAKADEQEDTVQTMLEGKMGRSCLGSHRVLQLARPTLTRCDSTWLCPVLPENL